MCWMTLCLAPCLASLTAAPYGSGLSPAAPRGFLEPAQVVHVSCSQQGQVVSCAVREGDRVAAGDVLFRLDDELLRANLAIAEHEASRTSDQAAAEAERDNALRRVTTLRRMAADGHSGGEELARAEADLKLTTAKRDSAAEQRESRRLEAARIRLERDRRRIVAPIGGIVTRLLIEPGETVGTEPLAVVVEVSRLRATLHVPVEIADEIADDIADGEGGEGGATVPLTVPLTVQTRRGPVAVQGAVEFLSPVIDAESDTVRMTVLVDNADRRLRAGTPCWLDRQVDRSR